MKAVTINKPGDIEVSDINTTSPEHGMAQVRIKACGICGSDIGSFRGTFGLVSYPRVIGHELAGEIVSISENNPNGLKIGDHVVLDPYIFCGHCYPCSIGRTNCCESLKVLGVHTDGGMAELFNHPENLLIKIPDGIPWEIACLAEPLTIALHCIHRLRLQPGEHIAISGAGAIGILAAMVAFQYGAVPIIIDVVEERLEMARSFGIEMTVNSRSENLIQKVQWYTSGRLAECVLEASGANPAIRSSLDIVCHAGRIAYTGWPNKETSLPTSLLTFKEIDMLGSRVSAGEFTEAIEMIAENKVEVRKLLSKVVSIDEVPIIIPDIANNPGNYLKVVALL